MDTVEMIEALAATPGWLRQAVAAVLPNLAARAPAPNEWSAADLFAHLRASDAILAPRVYQLLTRPGAPIAGYDERIWARVTGRAKLPILTQLTTFEAQRAELVGVLRTLTPKEWQIGGVHETRGQLTVLDIATDLARHELEHRAQLERIIVAIVGPTDGPRPIPASRPREPRAGQIHPPRKRSPTRPRTTEEPPSPEPTP